MPYGEERGKSFLVNRAGPKLVIKRSSNFLSMQNRRRAKRRLIVASRRCATDITTDDGTTIECSFFLFLQTSRTILCHFSAFYKPFAKFPRYLRMCVLMTSAVIYTACSRDGNFVHSFRVLREQKYFLPGCLVVSYTLFSFRIIQHTKTKKKKMEQIKGKKSIICEKFVCNKHKFEKHFYIYDTSQTVCSILIKFRKQYNGY